VDQFVVLRLLKRVVLGITEISAGILQAIVKK
jgi:hypothetical protein